MASLAEINKTLKEQTSAIEYGNEGTDDLRMKFGAFVDSMQGNAGDRREKELEAGRMSRAGRARAAGPRGMARGFGAGIGGLLGGLGGFGKAAATLGIAGLLAMQFVDGAKIKTNVETLLSIGERYKEDTIKTLFSDGATILALKGLGVGMLVFSAGAAASVGVDTLDKKTMDKYETSTGWSENVKTNVLNLLSISDGVTGALKNLWDGILFVPAMAGLSLGLGAFAIGQAFAGGAEAFTNWSGTTDWAENIKNNVITLLSIKDELGGSSAAFVGDGAMFALAMGGLGGGLALFGSGAIISGGADMLGDWFGDGTDWSQAVFDNVRTLLSIANLPGLGVDVLKFDAAMLGLGGGLAAFGIGTGAAAISDFIADWAADGKGRQNWTEELKKNVRNVLSIVDMANEGKAFKFAAAMGTISAGLVAFASATFITGLTNAAEAILSFFTKQDNAFDQIMRVAENADDLHRGAVAVDSLTTSIDKLGKLKFDGRTINMKAFALDLADSIKVIETAVDGGTFDASWLPFNAKTVKGLSNPEVNYEAAIRNIENLRAALRVGVNPNDIIDRYGNTFELPTNLDTIPAFRSGSGFSELVRNSGNGRGPVRIRQGFEENALDALAADSFRLNKPLQINIDQSQNSVDQSQNTSSSVVATGPQTDSFELHS